MFESTDLFSNPTRPEICIEQHGNVFFDCNRVAVGVTEQFIENADTYHERYFDRLDFLELIENILTLAKIECDKPLLCLDIGSGSGCSVLATAKLLPNANIIASDISPQLLNILGSYIANNDDIKDRIKSYCFDLHVPFFKANCFDLVIGTAILHHLIDPYEALKNIAISLKVGGKIALVEPLESGHLVLSIIYDQVLDVLKNLGHENGVLAQLMHAMRLDIQARLGVPKVQSWTAFLDDKWVFNPDYLNTLSRQLHMSRVEIFPNSKNVTNVFESAFRSLINDSGNGHLELPPEVIAVVREFDKDISLELKKSLCPTGIIIFTK